MKQLIMDIETLGSDSKCVILCASFLVYDLIEDQTTHISDLEKRVVTFKLSVDEQIAAGRTKMKSTIQWWKDQLEIAPHLRSILSRSPDDLTMIQFYSKLTSWLKEQGYNKRKDFAWQRGTLDIMVIDSLFDTAGYAQKQYPINWWKVRELRTAIDLLGDTELNGYVTGIINRAPTLIPGFTKHNSAHDILLEVVQLREIGLFKYAEFRDWPAGVSNTEEAIEKN